jgi:pimeloyl-ACP methyl ester carboxylesterase
MEVSRTGEQFTAVAGGEVELAYETFGDRSDPAVLLIMGLGAQMILWPDELCEALARAGYFVIRFDNRDAGRSTLLEGQPPYRLEDMANDAIGLLDALGIEGAHIVGASLGGMIAQRVAIDHPERVLSLASIMSTTGNPEVGRPTAKALAVLMTRFPSDREGFVRATVNARAVIGSQPPNPERTADLAGRAFDRGYHPEGTARQFAAIAASPDRTPELASIDVPTLVLHGSDDPLITVSGGEATAAAIPGAELVVIEGMAHDLPLSALDRIAEALQRNFERAGTPA